MCSPCWIDIAITVFLILASIFGYKWGSKFLGPLAKAKEYVNWYKVGRIKQFAKENNIDIDEVIATEKIKDRKEIIKSWTQKIEHKLSKELEDVEELKEKKK